MAPKGKYFYIISQLNGLVLDIEGEDESEGASVVTWERNDAEPDNQLWYEEQATGTIRSKLNNLCITATDDGLKMEEYDEDNEDQQWVFKRAQGYIRNRNNRDRVLDIMDNNEDPGAKIAAWEENDQPNQKWEMDRVTTRYFMIRSRLNDLVLDIEGGTDEEGAKLIMWEENGADNQLWFEDEDGIIRSKMHDFSMCADKGDHAKVVPCESDREACQWHRVGPFIARRDHRGHLVLDIKDASDEQGAEVTAWDKNGDDNQRWRFEYH